MACSCVWSRHHLALAGVLYSERNNARKYSEMHYRNHDWVTVADWHQVFINSVPRQIEIGVRMLRYAISFLLLASITRGKSLRRQTDNGQIEKSVETYYYETTNPELLGEYNEAAALGNPLKGLFGGPRWFGLDKLPMPDLIPSSLEWYNIAVSHPQNVESKKN